MAMGDAGRSALDGWRRGSLLLFGLAVCGLIAALLSGNALISFGGLAAVAAVSGSLHVVSRRRYAIGINVSADPADEISVLPSAARSVLECVEEPLLVLD